MTPNQCLQVLALCRAQAPLGEEAAIRVARRAIDEYMREAAADWSSRHARTVALRSTFEEKYPGADDPAVIRGYLESIDHNLWYEAEEAALQ